MVEKRDLQTYAIIGAAMEVHRLLGCGFLEPVYQEALAKEFSLRRIPYEREVELVISYKNEPLTCRYRADFLCYGEVIVELKALSALSGIEEAQVINYLKATGKQRALLINFGAPSLMYRRLVLNYQNLSADDAEGRRLTTLPLRGSAKSSDTSCADDAEGRRLTALPLRESAKSADHPSE